MCRDAEQRGVVVSPALGSDLFPELSCWNKADSIDHKVSKQQPMVSSRHQPIAAVTVPMNVSKAIRPMKASKVVPMVASASAHQQIPSASENSAGPQNADSKMVSVKNRRGTDKNRKKKQRRVVMHDDEDEKEPKPSSKYPQIPDGR
jgi:hypothetical protein